MTLFILLIFIATLERKAKIQKLRNNLSNFPPMKLMQRLDSFHDILKDKQSYSEMYSAANQLCKIDYRKITKKLDEMDRYGSILHFYSVFKFRSLYLELFALMSEYESEYLNIRFALFDLTSDIEVEKAVLKKLKEQATHVIETINYSPIDRIRDSKKLETKINKLRNTIKNIEEMIEDGGLHLTNDFLIAEEKLQKLIEQLAIEVDFMKESIDHLQNDLKNALNAIEKKYSKHKAILNEVEPEISKYKKAIKSVNMELQLNIDNIKVKEGSKNMATLNNLINELHLIVHSNVDYAKFNNENDYIPSEILNFVNENHGMFVSEIKRHRLNDEQTRLVYVDSAHTNLLENIKKYEYKKMDKFVQVTPSGINQLLMNVIHSYVEYIKVVSENVRDISEVNASTNDINMVIAGMNTSLLQVEYNIISLRGHQKDNLEKEKEALQRDVQKLREHFRDNTSIIGSDAQKIVSKIKQKVDDLVNKSRGTAFEVFFLKETILYINRFKGTNDKLDLMIESVTESYNDEKYTDALRKAKEIIEIYGIK